MRGLSRLLAAAFFVAQFAGLISLSDAKAESMPRAMASQVYDHHVHEHGDGMKTHHHGHSIAPGDDCCALHAFLTGVLPPPITVATTAVRGTLLVADITDRDLGLPPSSLDRPPRPLC
jgi:hypothetical protein